MADEIGSRQLRLDSNEIGNELFIYGFPGLYAGANTELHHQIILWRSMGLKVHLIPGHAGYRQEPLYAEMLQRGVIVHQTNQLDAIIPGAPVLGYCNDRFLTRLDEIRRYTHNTVFVNCMTWLFSLEKHRHREGKIAAFLYQNDVVRQKHEAILREINPGASTQYITFNAFFDTDSFPFICQETRKSQLENEFVIGRISRHDADKYSSDTLDIWNAIESPAQKHGIMLGFGEASRSKIGDPPSWVEAFKDQTELTQKDFYRQIDVIVQPMDTTENWPRIGMEAMASGVVLIVDNRGGWPQMIEHGVSGWLCDTPDDFIHYATRMAHEPAERAAIAQAARERLNELAGVMVSSRSWSNVLAGLGVQAIREPGPMKVSDR